MVHKRITAGGTSAKVLSLVVFLACMGLSAAGAVQGQADSAPVHGGSLALPPPPPPPANPKQTNLPSEAGTVKKVAEKFKGTHDLAGAAEALVAAAGPQFVYHYGDKNDPQKKPITNIGSLDELYGQRLLICYEFVHYVAYLASIQRVSSSTNPDGTPSQAPLIGSAGGSVYSARNYQVWDETSPVPRGKLIIFVAPFGSVFNNNSGYYHIGISLGKGKIAHASSGGGVQISDLSDVNSMWYSEVRIADYNWQSASDPYKPPAPLPPLRIGAPVVEPGKADVAPVTPRSRVGAATPLFDDPEVREIFDAAPQGIRFAAANACCGDPMGSMYGDPTAMPISTNQLFVTGAPLEEEIFIPAPLPPVGGNGPIFQGLLASLHLSRLPMAWPVAPRRAVAARLPGQSGDPGDARVPPGPAPTFAMIATGASSGDAFRLQIFGEPGVSGRLLAPAGLVLEPVAATAPLPRGGGTSLIVRNLPAFCADFSKPPPPPGMMYRVASASHQARLKPMRQLIRAADELWSAGRLSPDSNPAAYLDFAKQWSIWTRLERWDANAFGKAFVERTKQNLEELGRNWSEDLEQTTRARVPGRWQDIQRVLREVAVPERSAK